jgi:dGTPase
MTELAPYSARPETSRGRRIAEPAPEGRSEFQRDRDRIVHSTAFRRLEYKTQVFVNHEGDLFRTRLTHSIEVAQIARSIARNLALNEDLVESIALAHDLGHTPFGHSGQDALNECMRDFGGFEHNLQSLRVVDVLEQRYGGFDGLNLCFETREGIIKHCSQANAKTLGELGQRFLLKRQPSLEAQLANFADEIAYNNHDVDDGLRSGLITLDQISETRFFARHMNEVKREFPDLQDRRLIHETIRRMINTLVTDLTEESRRRVLEYRPADLEAIRAGPMLISFSAEIKSEQRELQGFLRKNLYKHYRVQRMSNKARRIVRELFVAFRDDLQLLPPEFQVRARDDAPRAIADYVAGMTDRYAIKEYRRIFTVDIS